MLPCFRMREPDGTLLNPLTHPEHCRKISLMSAAEAKECYEAVGREEKELELSAQAFAGMCLSISEKFKYIMETSEEILPYAWARLSEKFRSSDKATKYNKYSKLLSGLSIADYDHDLDRYIAEIKLLSTQLRNMGCSLDEWLLITVATNGLLPVSRYKSVRYSLATEDFRTFKQAADAMSDLFSANKLVRISAKKEKERGETTLQMVDQNGKDSKSMVIKNPTGSNRTIVIQPPAHFFYSSRGRGRRGGRGYGERGGRRGRRGGRRGGRFGRGNGKRKDPPGQQHNGRKDVRCFICNRLGHYARECWHRADTNPETLALINEKCASIKNANKKQKSEGSKQFSLDDGNETESDEDSDTRLKRSERNQTKSSNKDSDEESMFTMMSTNQVESKVCEVNESSKLKVSDVKTCNTEHVNLQGNAQMSSSTILDGGATSHVLNDREYFTKLLRLAQPRRITVGSGKYIYASHMGEAKIKSKLDNGSCKMATLTKALFCPDSAVSVVSQSRLDRAGYTIITTGGVSTITDKAGKKIGQATLKKGLYYMDVEYLAKDLKSPLAQRRGIDENHMFSLSESEIFHRRLIHVSPEKMKHALEATTGVSSTRKTTIYKNLKRKDHKCAICDATQTKRAKRRTGTARRVDARMHADTKTLKRSVRGFKHFVVFVHEGSRYLQIFKAKKKSEIPGAARFILKKHANITGAHVAEFRADNGSEFANAKLARFFKNKGIEFNPSTPRTPEQNGMAERAIQTIVTKIRAVLKQAGMSHKWWCYAVDYVVHTLNRVPHSKDDAHTPYENYFGKKPDISELRAFGCICVLPIDKRLRAVRGLSDTGKHVRLIGYGDRFAQYIVKTRKGNVTKANIDKFYEDVYSFKDPALKLNPAMQTANKTKNKKPKQTSSSSTHTDDAEGKTTNQSSKPKIDIVGTRKSKRMNVGVPPAKYGLDEYNSINYFMGENYLVDKTPVERLYTTLDVKTAEKLEGDVQISSSCIEGVPGSYFEAVTGPEKDYWIPSIAQELKSLEELNTWDIVKKPTNAKLVSTKWVFRKKINPDGTIRYKSRLVARGFDQTHGVDWYRSYAPTLSLGSLRIFLANASKQKLKVRSLDIKAAYLYGQVDADIYMKIPEGYMPQNTKEECIMRDKDSCAHLNKSIYGLVQSGYIWNRTFVKSLKRMGFKQIESDACLFIMIRGGRKITMGIYVDDILLAYDNDDDLQCVLRELTKEYKFRDMGQVKSCLGLDVLRNSYGEYSINQTRYIEKMIKKFDITPSKRAQTPLPCSPFTSSSPEVDKRKYRSLIGAILYVTVATRPDTAQAISRLSQYSTDPREDHLKAAQRLMKYLYNTKNYNISFNSEDGLRGFSDATHGTEKDGKSRSGYFLTLCGGPILWGSHRQRVVANSIAEAEYMAMSQLGRDIVYARQLLAELGHPQGTAELSTPLHEDCAPAIRIATNPGFSKASKSIRIAYHNVRQLVRDNIITIIKIPGENQPADILTKPLSKRQTLRHCRRMFREY